MLKRLGIYLTSLMLLGAAAHSSRAAETSLVDYIWPEPPAVGASTVHVLTPYLLEVKLISTKDPDPARVARWDFVDGSGQFNPPPLSAFQVMVDGQPVAVTTVGFKRRPLFAPIAYYDLRIENSLYLQLASPVSDGQSVQVTNPDGTLWASDAQFTATADPLRYSPAIHVNQVGYVPNLSKKAMVGYYVGNLGEIGLTGFDTFTIVEAASGKQVYQGSLKPRADVGYTYTPAPYTQVREADFSAFQTPGEYRLVVPGLGASLVFRIDNAATMAFARAYALGLYHQRCGTATQLPYTRFTHAKCHGAAASVPATAEAYPFTWTTIAGYGQSHNPDNPPQTAPAMTSPETQLFPFINQGQIDVSGGHHDAGDYSKYTINSASLIHYLMFEVDSLPGVAGFDNLGIPESGDGISDVMQEAKWEADFLAKMQDKDGGFYFLVYPKTREYENDVTPDRGDAQVVWPKTTSVTAASVAALAQTASSPRFKQAYPKEAAAYLEKAKLGWQFLLKAIQKYGKDGAYQKITHYGDDFADRDELAWAACQMFLATGDANAHKLLLAWFDPSDPSTRRWGWWHMSQAYGHAIRSYAFAARSGRVQASSLDQTFLAKCEAEVVAAGDDVLKWANQSAYGTSFPDATKAVRTAGWYFSTDQAFDIAVAYQIKAKAGYMAAMLENMNYEGGCNPVNASCVSGLGWKRTRNVVSQWASNSKRKLPPTGQPVGNVQSGFFYLWNYGTELSELTFPSDDAANPYPFYDRWGDVWNVSTEFVVLNSARSLGTVGFLAAVTGNQKQAWKPTAATISVPQTPAEVGKPITLTLQAPGMDLSTARIIVWEGSDQAPIIGSSYTFTPQKSGAQWAEAEAQWPDGRRAFAHVNFKAQ